MKQPANPFNTEAELCAAFIPWARHHGWTAYPETAGWDLLMVSAAGVQLGIHAKLAMNLKVVAQCLEGRQGYDEEGPDFAGVLVGGGAPEGNDICRACGLAVFRPVDSRYRSSRHIQPGADFSPQLPDLDASFFYTRAGDVGTSLQPWHPRNPVRRHTLPAYIPDVAAGVPGPVQLTPWKVKALRLCAMLELRGHVTRADFRSCGIDHRPWTTPGGWLIPSGEGRWTRGPGLRFEGQHPVVFAQIRDEVAVKLAASTST